MHFLRLNNIANRQRNHRLLLILMLTAVALIFTLVTLGVSMRVAEVTQQRRFINPFAMDSSAAACDLCGDDQSNEYANSVAKPTSFGA